MKKTTFPKAFWLFLFVIPLLSSCTYSCDEFPRNSQMLTIVFFPDGLPSYEFARPDDPNANTIRLIQQRFDFSEAYEQADSDDSDCYSTHRTRYSSDELPFLLGNDLAYGHIEADPIEATIRYLAFQAGDEIIADLTYELPPDNGRILRDINNLVISRLTVNGETFDDVMRIELNAVNITLFVERGKGLQGILYGGEIYRRID